MSQSIPLVDRTIRSVADAARALAEERAALGKVTPFGSALEETLHDLGRVAAPVVAFLGQAKAGKSSLVNALVGTSILPVGVVPTTAMPVCLRAGAPACMLRNAGHNEEFEGDREAIRARIVAPRLDDEYLVWQVPELDAFPWHWLDTPGWDALDRNLPVDLEPSHLADLWVVTTSATHPMSVGDRLLLAQLAAIAQPGQVLVVVTRCDQIEQGRVSELLEYVERIIGQVWTGEPPPALTVSSATKQGLDALRDKLAKAVLAHMHTRLTAELGTWRKMLDELGEIGRMRSLASLESDTLATARERLHSELSAAIAELKQSVDTFTQEIVDSLEDELPAAQRIIAPVYAKKLEQRVVRAVDAIGDRLEKELADVLGADLQQRGSVASALRAFSVLLDRRSPEGFEGRGAAVGATLGVGAGFSAAIFAALPFIGIPLAVASLAAGIAGGALGALLGGREILVDTERLRERVGLPLAREVTAELDRVMAAARLEIDRLCDMMGGAAALQQASPTSGPAAQVREAVEAAKARAGELATRLDALRSEVVC